MLKCAGERQVSSVIETTLEPDWTKRGGETDARGEEFVFGVKSAAGALEMEVCVGETGTRARAVGDDAELPPPPSRRCWTRTGTDATSS